MKVADRLVPSVTEQFTFLLQHHFEVVLLQHQVEIILLQHQLEVVRLQHHLEVTRAQRSRPRCHQRIRWWESAICTTSRRSRSKFAHQPGPLSYLLTLVSPFLSDKLITIALEGIDERFTVSKALLCNASDYFRKALDGGFRESSENLLRLPGCDIDTLRLFIGFLTCNALPSFGDALTREWLADDSFLQSERVIEYQDQLIRLWAFGDSFLLLQLQDGATVSFMKLLEYVEFNQGGYGYIPPESIQLAFDITSKDSPISKMLVCIVAHVWKHYSISEEALERFGAIPGFFVLFLAELKKCPRRDCRHKQRCWQPLATSRPRVLVPQVYLLVSQEVIEALDE